MHQLVMRSRLGFAPPSGGHHDRCALSGLSLLTALVLPVVIDCYSLFCLAFLALGFRGFGVELGWLVSHSP